MTAYRAPQGWRALAGASEARDRVLVTWGSGDVRDEAQLLAIVLGALDDRDDLDEVVVLSGSPAVLEGAAAFATSLDPPWRLRTRRVSANPPLDEMGRARLVVCHGGWGSINEAVALGAPVLVVPELAADRMETAQRVITAHVGTSVDRYTLSVETTRTAIGAMLGDPIVQQSVAEVGTELRDERAMVSIQRRLRRELER